MAKSRYPYLPFYTRDWLGDMELQSCSTEAKGLWIDMICYMHQEGEPYGHLSQKKKPLSSKQISHLFRVSSADLVEDLLKQLCEANVYSVDSNGLIYSRRLLRDMDLHKTKVKAGRLGGKSTQEKNLLKQNIKQNVKQKSSRTSSKRQAEHGSGYGSGYGYGSEDVKDENIEKNIEENTKETEEEREEKKRNTKEKKRREEEIPRARSVDEIPEWALEIRQAWNDWRQKHGVGADSTASPKGQGLKNLLKLAEAPESVPPESLARGAERYLSTVNDAQFVCAFANFWGQQRRFEAFLADDWQPPVGSAQFQSMDIRRQPLDSPGKIYD